jgi:hypothetical protein
VIFFMLSSFVTMASILLATAPDSSTGSGAQFADEFV